MAKTKWWLRIVGGFYLLLVTGSLWVLFINPRLFGDMFPYSTDDTTVRAFSDAWLIFVLEMLVLGIIMLYASRKPERNGILVVTIAALELIRGGWRRFVVDDARISHSKLYPLYDCASDHRGQWYIVLAAGIDNTI